MRLILTMIAVAAIMVVGRPSPIFATEFLFSEDNQITGDIDLSMSRIEPKSLLRENKWFNEPLTRLDYVLMKLETSLREDLTSLASELSKEFFESSRGGLSPKFDVQYSEETGRLLIATKVRDVGKPKKPMKDFCKGMLSWMERLYPKQQVGFLWHNRALGILQRDKPSKYQDAVSTLFNSLVYIVDVSATYDTGGKTTLFVLACIKQEADEPISYFKYSYDLKK